MVAVAVAGAFTAVAGSVTGWIFVGQLNDTTTESLDVTEQTLDSVDDTIDGVVRALSDIPFGPDCDPDDGLEETFGRLAESLEPVPGELETTAGGLTDFTDSAGDLQERLDELAASVRTVDDDLTTTTDDFVEQYRASVADARAVARRAGDDLDGTVTVLRVLLVIGGFSLLVGQIVPLWVGRELLVTRAADTERAPIED